MKRSLILAAFCPMAISIAMGQGSSWTYTIDRPGLNTYAVDAIETTTGVVIALSSIVQDNYNQGTTDLAILDDDGTPSVSVGFWSDLPYGVTNCLVPRSSGSGFDAVGVLTTIDGHWKFFSYGFDEAGNRLDSSTIHVPNAQRVFMDNAIRASNDDRIFAGSATSDGDFYSRLVMARMSEGGDSLDYAEFHNPFNFFAPRDVTELAPDTFMVSSTAGFVELGTEFGGAFLTRIGPDLQPIDALPPVAVDGSGSTPGWYNSFTDTQHLVPLETGNLVIGGRIGTGNNGTRSALMKVGPTGDWLGSFMPQTDFSADHPGMTGNVDRTAIGELLFATMDNFFFFPNYFQPTDPNQIRIYKLDTALNVLCTNVVDGFGENAYYWLNRIKATSDGGYLLLGSRVDLSQPVVRFQGWAHKFNADDCFTGLHEQSETSPAQVFPNPGSDHFTIALNGPERLASVHLHDVSGKMLRSEKIRHGTSRMETSDLASGIYLYRIVDGQGRAIASGSWVKE